MEAAVMVGYYPMDGCMTPGRRGGGQALPDDARGAAACRGVPAAQRQEVASLPVVLWRPSGEDAGAVAPDRRQL